MGACCKLMCGKFPTHSSDDIPDEYFKHFTRDKHTGKQDPIDKKVKNMYLMYYLKNSSRMGDYHKDVVKGRAGMSNMFKELAPKTWPDYQQLAEGCDETCVKVETEPGVMVDNWVFKPKGYEGAPLACMVYAHGGGGVLGSTMELASVFRNICLVFGICMIGCDYRLAPETKQPGSQIDMQKSFLYFHENAAQYNIDPTRMTIAGESGGGQACLGGVRMLMKSGDLDKVRVCFLHEPMIDGSFAYLPEDQNTKEEWMGLRTETVWLQKQHAVDYEKQLAEKDPLIMPALMPEEEVAQMPMTFVMTSEFDHLRRDGLDFARRLMKHGKLAGVSDLAGLKHGWSFDGNIPGRERFYNEWKIAFEAYTGPQ